MAKYGSVYLSGRFRDFFLSLHRMANLPTRLGKLPYTGWQNLFCKQLNFQGFSAAFSVYKSFYKFLYKFFYNSPRAVWW
jgi:hypothetical protein